MSAIFNGIKYSEKAIKTSTVLSELRKLKDGEFSYVETASPTYTSNGTENVINHTGLTATDITIPTPVLGKQLTIIKTGRNTPFEQTNFRFQNQFDGQIYWQSSGLLPPTDFTWGTDFVGAPDFKRDLQYNGGEKDFFIRFKGTAESSTTLTRIQVETDPFGGLKTIALFPFPADDFSFDTGYIKVTLNTGSLIYVRGSAASSLNIDEFTIEEATGPVTIECATPELIDGKQELVLETPYQKVSLVGGTNGYFTI